MRTLYLACLATAAVSSTAIANEFEAPLRALAQDVIVSKLADPAIADAIMVQNAANAALSEADVLALDTKWRAEVGTATTPTIEPVMSSPLADMLRGFRDESEGLFTEIFVMDQVGLNVAASDVTSDFWQGDEAKWQETYVVGADAVHISDVEFDESTQTYQSQVSVSIVDPATNQPIGAATFGVNVEMLF